MINKIKQLLGKNYSLANSSKEINLIDKFYNHSRTITKKSTLDVDGDIIPWYTYPAIEFVNQFDFTGKRVFEWGSGNSSTFFSNKKVDEIISVDHDTEWFNKVKLNLQSNQQLVMSDLKQYPSHIDNFSGNFDVIIIDGQRRFDCAKAAISKLSANGMIILDNSDWFYVSAAYLKKELDLIQVDFHGLGPINNYTWTTSIFFTKNFNFPLLKKRQPCNAIGGLHHDEIDIIKNEDNLFQTSNSNLVDTLLS